MTQIWCTYSCKLNIKKSLKIPKAESESINSKWTENIMPKRKSTKKQTMM